MVPRMRPCAHPAMPENKRTDALQVVPDSDTLAVAAAEIFVTQARAAIRVRGQFLVALSGGGTPQKMFALLASPSYQTRVDWPAIHVFWGDERLVPPGDPGSSATQAQRLLLDHVPIPADQIHRMRGELAIGDAIADYKQKLQAAASGGKRWPRFDLALLGMGVDGHTASLFPGKPAVFEKDEPVAAVTAAYQDRPSERITLTPPVFNDAHLVLFLVAGADKAAALAAVLQGQKDIAHWPAQAIHPASGDLIWLVDKTAASLLSD